MAFVSGGRLFTLKPGGEALEIDSPFAQKVVERASRDAERHGWKGGSMGWQTGASPELAAIGLGGGATAETTIVVRGLDRSGPERLVYILQAGATVGLFERDLADQGEHRERRLFHKQSFQAADAAAHPSDGRIIVSLQEGPGIESHLALFGGDRPGLSSITDGDCIDEAPAWVATAGDAAPHAIVYQSAGIGRDGDGNLWGIGPRHVEWLDLDDGERDTLVEEPSFDCLTPRATSDGSLWYLRRPYEEHRRPSLWQQAKFLVASPVIFVVGLFTIVQTLAAMLRGEPPKTAGGPRGRKVTPTLRIYGAAVEASRRGVGSKREEASDLPIAPSSWTLRCRDADGKDREVTTGVLAFDVADAAQEVQIVATDGRDVFGIDLDSGNRVKLGRYELVDRVCLVP